MNLYDKYVLPKVTNVVCSSSATMKQREKVVPLASGKVLEIGIGSGLNFGYYDHEKVDQILAIDPSEEMWAMAKKKLENNPLDLTFAKGYAENIPIESQSIDSILITYVLCTIVDYESAIREFKRVLKPGGSFIFCEHGIAPSKSVRNWQNRLNPIWKRLGGGCNLNRDIPTIIKNGGFEFEKLETMHIQGPKIVSYNYWGVAKPI